MKDLITSLIRAAQKSFGAKRALTGFSRHVAQLKLTDRSTCQT